MSHLIRLVQLPLRRTGLALLALSASVMLTTIHPVRVQVRNCASSLASAIAEQLP